MLWLKATHMGAYLVLASSHLRHCEHPLDWVGIGAEVLLAILVYVNYRILRRIIERLKSKGSVSPEEAAELLGD
jgi:hypothetical protein